MKNVQFEYLWVEPKFDVWDTQINAIKNDYERSKKKIEKRYVKSLRKYNKLEIIKNINVHKKEIIKVIKQILKLFPQINYIPILICLNGSFARNTNRLNSDIDLSIFYPDEFKSVLTSLEEYICYCIAYTLGFKRDRIHSIMLHTMTVNSDYQKEYTIIHNNGKIINYDCRDNTEGDMYRIHFSKKSFDALKEYLSENITEEKCCEWCYTFEVIFDNTDMSPILNNIELMDAAVINKDESKIEFNNLLKSYKDNLIKEVQRKVYSSCISIDELKKAYKTEPLCISYNLMAIIRRRCLFNNIDIGLINLEKYSNDKKIRELLGREKIKEVFERTYKYLWFVMRLEYILHLNKIELSSHDINKIDISEFTQKYNKEFNSNIENFIEYQEELRISYLALIISTIDLLMIEK